MALSPSPLLGGVGGGVAERSDLEGDYHNAGAT
jgi:hypothetical protein